MRRLIIMIFAAVLLFSTVVYSDATTYKYDGKDILANFTANVHVEGGSVKILYSDISEAIGKALSFNSDTGFINAEESDHSIYIKVLDETIKTDEEAFVFPEKGETEEGGVFRFNVFVSLNRLNNMEILPEYFAGNGSISVLAEASVEVADNKANILLRKNGTSYDVISPGNMNQPIGNNLLLINRNNMLDKSYIPSNIVYTKPSKGRSAGYLRLDREAAENLNMLLEAASRDGVNSFVTTSGYRAYDKQSSLFYNKVNLLSRKMNRKAAFEEASKVVAVPGSSEHQTGLAADICSESTSIIADFIKTKQGRWLNENCWKYGFIIRYPEDKTTITGIIYEPWHVRYVGAVHSEFMKKKNICLEEYVEYIKNNKVSYFKDSYGSSYLIQYLHRPDFDASGAALSLPDTGTWSISNCTKDSYILTIKL